MADAASTDQRDPADAPRPAVVIAAFAIVYVVWGSTYLAIRFAVESLPPFAMAGARFLFAGVVLLLWARLRGHALPTRRGEWRTAAIAGVLLLFGGNGSLVWAEQRIASGIAALLVATLPVWMVLLDWWRPGGERPRAGVFVGLALGLGGLALLVGPSLGPSGGSRPEVDLAAAGVLMVGSISWAAGSIYLRHVPAAANATISNGMQMLAGGLALCLVGVASGELGRFDSAAVTTRSALSLLYLAIFGSIVAFSAYTYILRVSTPARVATYAYVNPVVAMLLGWAFASEPVTARTLGAAAVILAGVATITLTGGTARRAEAVDRPAAARGRAVLGRRMPDVDRPAPDT